MGDRGNCKFFAPNYFYPTKCQNCFKQKEQHSAQELAGADGAPSGKTLPGGQNIIAPKRLLKESVLLKASIGRDNIVPETWVHHWFALYSNGELQEYAIDDGQINKDNMMSSVMLQNFIRMLDGKVELNEKLCFGIKTLRETIYFKTTTKVDYENWWKEVSSFVASPLKRTTSASVNTGPKSGLGALQRPSLCKQLSVPISTISPSRSSRSSSTASLQSEPEDPQMEGLRKQLSKLEEENSKLSKSEKQRRELELEVNYWKEYVTNAGLVKQSGGSSDTVTELAESRRSLIQLQDELNQTQKKLKTNTGKLLIKNKELTDYKEKLRESNSITAVYKAKIDQLTKERSKNDTVGNFSTGMIEEDKDDNKLDTWNNDGDYFESGSVFEASTNSDAQHLEDKFLLLKDKLKRIERELLIKSKELEKANDSRSKVAKYTRSLLQELETRLRDNQQKLSESQEKLKNTNIELGMERERRMKLEESPRRRMSNVVTSPKSFQVESYANMAVVGTSSSAIDLSDLGDVDTKYADYYRSRFKEAESSLLEKDKKLHQAEEKIKEIQGSMKTNSDTYKVINEMQVKLSDATHKLSDRQLKIHELTCEVDRLKKFEKTYGKKRQQCGALEDIVKDLETTNSEIRKNMHQVKQELEIVKIREVVLKEQLQIFADDGEESDLDDERKLGKAVDLKNKIECMVDLESRCKKLAIDNDNLLKKNAEYETRLRHLNMLNFKNLESSKEVSPAEIKSDNTEKKIKELEQSLAAEEEKFCNQLSQIKEQYLNQISALEKNSQKDIALAKDELAKAKIEIDKLSSNKSEMEIKIEELVSKVYAYEKGGLSHSRHRKIERLDEVDMDDNKMQEEKMGISEETSSAHIPNQKKNSEKCDVGKMDDDETIKNEISTGKGSADIGVKDRDSGIVITQEIKSMIDAAKNIEVFSCDTDDIFSIPHDSVSEIDIIKKYKAMCSKFQDKMKELGTKYVLSEEKCIQLAQTLDQLTQSLEKNSEQAFVEEYDILLTRIDELETQIIDSQELLQSKADELEKERKNVIHLVEVTSAYIKELEGSLEESKSKISNLEKGDEAPPRRESANKSNSEHDDTIDSEEAAAIRQKLTARIMTLQSDISELTDKHSKELDLVKSESAKELEVLRKQLAEAEVNPDVETIKAQVKDLEEELKNQNESYAHEVEMLNQHFQAELKQAFCGDNAGIDMLNRMQELEIEVEEVRKNCDCKIKDLEDAHEKEKAEIKEDMATVLQAHMSGSFLNAEDNSTVEELEERIVKLEQELEEREQKYTEDLELEKKAHQSEMEDTIRDMMMVRTASTRYDDTDPEEGDDKDNVDAAGSQLSQAVSQEEYSALKVAHDKEIEELKAQHEEETALIRSDFTIVISSLRQGSSSETIMDLQSKVNEHDEEVDKLRKTHKEEVDNMHTKLKRAESANFYATRRQEEMGCKIYNMQNELDEIEYKHQMEISSYQDKLGYLTGNQGDDVNDYMKEVSVLQEKNKSLEGELEEVRCEHDQKVESIIMKLQEEKRCEIEEMTDKVLKLESLIDEMKETHIRDLNAFEKTDREEKLEAERMEKERIRELETANQSMKVEYEEEIEELAREHKKEVEKLRVFYEKEMSDVKKKLSNDDNSSGSRKISIDAAAITRQVIKEQKEIHEKEVALLKSKFYSEKEAIEKQHQSTIDDIRIQYDEKLKMGYKEGLRRQSTTDRKSDGARMRQLINEKETLSTKLLEQEIKYDNDIKIKNEKINELEKSLEFLRTNSTSTNTNNLGNTSPNLVVNEDVIDSEIQKKVREMQEQIERFHRRIDYYHEKAARDNSEESPRVAELQSQIVELRKEMEELTEGTKRKDSEEEKPEKDPTSATTAFATATAATKFNSRRGMSNSEPARRHTDNVTVKVGRRKENDPRKRWSNLEETSEKDKDQNKSGSVLARKTLWENISTDDPKYTG